MTRTGMGQGMGERNMTVRGGITAIEIVIGIATATATTIVVVV